MDGPAATGHFVFDIRGDQRQLHADTDDGPLWADLPCGSGSSKSCNSCTLSHLTCSLQLCETVVPLAKGASVMHRLRPRVTPLIPFLLAFPTSARFILV